MNVSEMQKKLSRKAEKSPNHKFENLYGLLCNEAWLRVAHQSVSTNQGRETAGIDGQRRSNFNEDLEENLHRLSEELKAKTFEPTPVRRVYIPKANGKKRPLGIPTIADRIVQEALRMTLEPIWEADFSRHSYGFRPNRCTKDAIAYIGTRFATPGHTYQWIIEGDIKSYFDSIPHRKLMKRIGRRVQDTGTLDLIWKYLKAGLMEQGEYHETLAGTPQGGIVSPLLANIYLHDLDRYMEEHYVNLADKERRQRRRHGLANFLYARYADDFVVLCNGTREQAEGMRKELYNFLMSRLGLALSMEKTRVTHLTEGFKFLGFWMESSIGANGRYVPRIRIPEEAPKRVLYKIRAMLGPSTQNASVNAKILALNRVIGGWCRYYQHTSTPAVIFGKLRDSMFWDIAHWLGRKDKLSMPQVMRKYYRNKTFGTKTQRLKMPETYTVKRYKLKVIPNPYTSKPEDIERETLPTLDAQWTGYEVVSGRYDRRLEVLERGLICAACGKQVTEFEAQVDHIKPRVSFKRPKDADALNNPQVLCTECHRDKTKKDLKVLSRMR
jgi:RNA-directed DNA polymerase